MPTLTQTAFVRVDYTEQRKELCEWLERIGYRPSRALKMIEYVSCVFVDNGKLSVSANPTYLKRRLHAIDCGTNTKVFCALAVLRDDSDYGQWFFTQGGCWSICNCGSWSDDRTLSALWQKATPAEIVEHFRIKKE